MTVLSNCFGATIIGRNKGFSSTLTFLWIKIGVTIFLARQLGYEEHTGRGGGEASNVKVSLEGIPAIASLNNINNTRM